MREIFRKIMVQISIKTLKLLNEFVPLSTYQKIRNKYFYFSSDIFNPTFFVISSTLFVKHLAIPKGASVLDMGTGSGILAIFASEQAAKVLATDINPYALRNTRINIKLNRLSDKIRIRKGNLFNQITEKFDVILFNPPYFPLTPKSYMELAWCCGPTYNFLRNFLRQARQHLKPHGFVQMALSSLMHLDLLHLMFRKYKFRSILIARKFLLFEIIYIYILIPEHGDNGGSLSLKN